MALLIVGELLTLRFAMSKLSATRALVGGESLWSKAQKDAVSALQRYQVSKNESDFREFKHHLTVIQGDSLARIELSKDKPDLEVIKKGFLLGGIHSDDIPPITDLLRRFYWVSYIARAIEHWTKADELVLELTNEATHYREAMINRRFTSARKILSRISLINHKLTSVEVAFSESLGAGSRWLEHFILFCLTLIVITVESVGIGLALMTNRSVSKRLAKLQWQTSEISKGNFKQNVMVLDPSTDEIGRLSTSVNAMGAALESSYRDLEKKVEERTTEATNAVQMRDEFLQIASHELRTPLTSLSLELQLLSRKLEKLENSDIKVASIDLSEKSLKGVKRLTVLLDELLDLTRIQSGKFEVQPIYADLIPLLHESVSKYALEASQHGATISLHTPARLFAFYDPVKIEQVITNLISNALKYGGGTPIELIAAQTETMVCVSVKDHGPGIPLDKQEKIFSRFERVEGSSSVKGLGLGLYISKQIVDAHGGRIQVTSEPNCGATFTVCLHPNERRASAHHLDQSHGEIE